MAWVLRHSRRFWVGRHERLGLLVVPESELQGEAVDVLNVFVLSEQRVGAFKASTLRERIDKRSLGEEEAQKALDEYIAFNHSTYLRQAGRPLSPLRVAKRSRGRVTHCYRCSAHLDSDAHLECSACGWLVCTCGACGCGYSQ